MPAWPLAGSWSTAGTRSRRVRPGIGLRVHRLDGRRLLHLFGDDRVSHIQVHGGHAYVYSDAAVRVVDPGSGHVARRLPAQSDLVELLDGACES
jgi:hypothetical protein